MLERELQNYEFQFELLGQRLEQMEQVMKLKPEITKYIAPILKLSPIPEEQRRAGFGGVNRYKKLEGFGNSDQIIETTKQIDILSRMLVVQSKSLEEIQLLAEKKEEEFLAAIPSIQPIKKGDLKRMASGYGWRIDPFTKKRRRHKGMDFSANRGTPIYATGDGIVKRADNRSSGYERHVRIDHGFGYVSLYAHLYKYNVKRGQKVKRGDIIGFVGSHRTFCCPSLALRNSQGRCKINPLNFYLDDLSPAEFDAIVNQASQENQSLD